MNWKEFNENYTGKIKLIEQPTGHSCGITCLKMIYDRINPKNNVSIEELIEVCETDWIKGTTPERMKLGFEYLGIQYKEKYGFDNLKISLNNDKNCIIRTVTKGVPHWIVIDNYNYDTDTFFVLDPWLGKIAYNSKELDVIWKVRNYYYFEI